MKNKILVICAGFYLTMVVVCFGPAFVQGEDAAELEYLSCLSTARDQSTCKRYPFARAEGLTKALFWPFWLSYSYTRGDFNE